MVSDGVVNSPHGAYEHKTEVETGLVHKDKSVYTQERIERYLDKENNSYVEPIEPSVYVAQTNVEVSTNSAPVLDEPTTPPFPALDNKNSESPQASTTFLNSTKSYQNDSAVVNKKVGRKAADTVAKTVSTVKSSSSKYFRETGKASDQVTASGISSRYTHTQRVTTAVGKVGVRAVESAANPINQEARKSDDLGSQTVAKTEEMTVAAAKATQKVSRYLSRRVGKAAQRTAKYSKEAAKATETTAKATTKTAEATGKAVEKTAEATAKAAQYVAKVVTTIVEAIASNPWILIVVILIVAIIFLIFAFVPSAGIAQSHSLNGGSENINVMFVDKDRKNSVDLVSWCKNAEQTIWGYTYGAYGQTCTKEFLDQQASRYEDASGENRLIGERWIGRPVVDCIGLIKSYAWYDVDNEEITYNTYGFTDCSANSIWDDVTESGDISTIPEIPGIAVWKDGHIGVYVGNGEVIEAMGVKYGVIRTQLREGNWTKWLKIPNIIYPDTGAQPVIISYFERKEHLQPYGNNRSIDRKTA